MIIGQVVEILISLKDQLPLMSMEEDAVIEACNLLGKLPCMEEATTYEPVKN